jgi:hypothetical protein
MHFHIARSAVEPHRPTLDPTTMGLPRLVMEDATAR